ncbi:MAG: PA0069 family radical SAM protein [Gammaproteobacteria bacterium]|nr:PA0069 family radical SAM protein [Gammaproteobacteria bacterium]
MTGLSHIPRKGRGALSNPQGRFETRQHESVDDGWMQVDADPLPPLETTITPEPARSIISRNQSPDIPFAQSINPYRGCEHGCIYCLDGSTPILMTDGHHRPLAEIRLGDEIYGTQRRGWYRRYVKTRVLAHWSVIKPAYRILLEDDTELVAGADHRFLTERGWKFVSGVRRPHLTTCNKLMGTSAFASPPDQDTDYTRGYLCGLIRGDGLLASYHYERAGRIHGDQHQFRLALCDIEALQRAQRYLYDWNVSAHDCLFQEAIGNRRTMHAIRTHARVSVERVREIIAWPVDTPRNWRAGFLAGIFDAEGSYSQGILRISNTDPAIIDWTRSCLQHFGFRCAIEHVRREGLRPVTVLRLLGGLTEHLRFLHSTDPAISRKCDITGQAVKSGARLRITRIEPLNITIRLYDITTGTEDFIANGVVSHNCYARPSHAYVNLSPGIDFETRIFYKQHAAALLEKALRRPGYLCQPITLGANTDPYQPIERRLRVTRSLLEVLQRFHHPVSIITKGTLVTRDLDILAALAKQNLATVMVSVTTLDAELKRTLEPRAPGCWSRLRTIHALAGAGVPVGVLVAPIIPMVNDAEMERILQLAAKAGACCAGYVLLRLPHELKDLFREWLDTHMPLRAAHVMSLIRQAHSGREYRAEFGTRMRGTGQYAELLAGRFTLACKRYQLEHGRRMRLNSGHFRPPPPDGQLSLSLDESAIPFNAGHP